MLPQKTARQRHVQHPYRPKHDLPHYTCSKKCYSKKQHGDATCNILTDPNMIFLTIPAQKNATPKNSTATPRAHNLSVQTTSTPQNSPTKVFLLHKGMRAARKGDPHPLMLNQKTLTALPLGSFG